VEVERISKSRREKLKDWAHKLKGQILNGEEVKS
jgi:hypothetical protein